ncbi:hypothetical protein VIGAN_02013900, partial [Vigna angularis var. angularis]
KTVFPRKQSLSACIVIFHFTVTNHSSSNTMKLQGPIAKPRSVQFQDAGETVATEPHLRRRALRRRYKRSRQGFAGSEATL